MTDYTILSKYRNKEKVNYLAGELKKRDKTCYNFADNPADANNPDGSPEDQMKGLESVENFYENEHFKFLFKTDYDGLKNADTSIVLLPAGTASHIEAGIAYGLGKKLILIGEPEKPETLYLIFEERYRTVEEFLETI